MVKQYTVTIPTRPLNHSGDPPLRLVKNPYFQCLYDSGFT